MTLRTRLTVLYAAVAGAILLFFGIAIYGLVSVMLVDQMDLSLDQTAHQIITNTRVNAMGDLEIIELPSLDVTSGIFVQVWGQGDVLKVASPNISRLEQSLDPIGLRTVAPIYRDSRVSNASLRVLSVPLTVDDQRVGVLQIGENRYLVDLTLRTMLWVLAGALALFVSVAAIAGYLLTGQVLGPLEKVTAAASSITNADDLSRRIPNPEHSENEIGILIEAFNQTLNRLEQLFSTQKRFMADVSHELRTPLTVIKGNVSLLRKMKTPDEESLQTIEGEVDRLTRMVGDLLLLAQAESGKLPLNLSRVELDSVLLEVFQQVKVLAGDKINLKITDMEPVEVMADRDRIKQVYLNLLANAVKYTPSGGSVMVSIRRIQERIETTITDTGPGIPARDLPHIFERFYRGDKARTRSADGSSFGLGLSIAFWIVKNHGGAIEVQSNEGAGTTFMVWLPVLKESGQVKA
jgi:heavy metal sensor kinase